MKTQYQITAIFINNYIINDDRSDLILCFQSLLGLGMAGKCIQRHIAVTFFYSMCLQTVLLISRF